MAQRYYAAKSDEEAGKLTGFWTVLLAFRSVVVVFPKCVIVCR